MTILFSKKFWVASFMTIFLMALDYWAWDEVVSLSVKGLPAWIYYFVILQLILVLMIYTFSKYYWGNKEDK
ncbi:MAG TPA: hypothetical protein EYM84_09220 [Flavobacteriales bacterium]|nr:hypothetical protein [Flavobacteriales bacterium]HIN40439.1 hypothetical protein [Flavobacteriales bacterium]